jgi:MYXO-CTERM domain-containing protein
MAAWHFDFGAVETLPAAELADLTEGPAWPPRPVWVRTSSGASVVIDPMPRGAIDPPPARDADVEPEPTPDAGPPGERPDATPPGPFADAGPEPVAPGVDAAAAPTAPADSLTAAGPRTRQAALDGRAGCAATTGGLVSAGPGLFALVALGGLVRRRRGTGVRG